MSDKLQKLAGDAPGILAANSQHMRKLASQNVELLKRAEAAERECRLMKLARRMEARGLEPNLSYEEKLASLREVPQDKLASLEQAVEMAAGGFRLGTLDDPSDRGSKVATASVGEVYHDDGSDALEEFVTSQQAYG